MQCSGCCSVFIWIAEPSAVSLNDLALPQYRYSVNHIVPSCSVCCKIRSNHENNSLGDPLKRSGRERFSTTYTLRLALEIARRLATVCSPGPLLKSANSTPQFLRCSFRRFEPWHRSVASCRQTWCTMHNARYTDRAPHSVKHGVGRLHVPKPSLCQRWCKWLDVLTVTQSARLMAPSAVGHLIVLPGCNADVSSTCNTGNPCSGASRSAGVQT